MTTVTLPTLLVLLALLSLAKAIGSGGWSVSCFRATALARMDPIQSVGKISAHSHIIVGSNGFSMDMKNEDALNAECTTCDVTVDRSNYWIPQLYNRNRTIQQRATNLTLFSNSRNGTYTALRSGARPLYRTDPLQFEFAPSIYYKFNTSHYCPGSCAKIRAFPPGFRMVAGNPAFSRAGQAAPETIQYKCVGNPQIGHLSFDDWSFYKKYKCPGGLRVEITFPQCWDGRNLKPVLVTLKNGKKAWYSHTRYSKGTTCPSTHPQKIMQVFYEFLFYTDDFWVGDQHPDLIWSTGDTTGFGLHGDFFSGWDVGVVSSLLRQFFNLSVHLTFFTTRQQLQEAIDTCDFTANHPYLGIYSCKPLAKHLVFNPSNTEYQSLLAMAKLQSCNIKAKVPNETVIGTIPRLLGTASKQDTRPRNLRLRGYEGV
ncbi:hypothetical protein HK097_010292 [Rhizophlyctis rosea]|uniref:DUF1996 domain-containing protein n=1 Tax=Rhizophlyctis rosea TaxID=64517 RepID=A0AAD5SIQ7_9FUNG|nr:hypothetical protein HK097_010292 [Rhizophlyctis rosea]